MNRDLAHTPDFVRVFDEMAATYGPVNLAASFSFAARWRSQALEPIGIPAGACVADLMSGMGTERIVTGTPS